MADLGEKLLPLAQPLLAPGEEMRGCCVATESGVFKGRVVVIVVSAERLILQGVNRKFEPDGEPLSLPPERIAAASADGGGGGWPEVGAAIMDRVSVTLKLRTTEGTKLKLMMMRGDGALGGLGGGETQRQGVQALGEWFAVIDR
ncbi:MAG TPA: hypothetical protein VFX45_00285 [Solirubrobacterales bacterium]|nr:hypothetical protein [Solirubrobacterales bacterium]